MLNTKIKIVSSLVFISALIGCGGSGGSAKTLQPVDGDLANTDVQVTSNVGNVAQTELKMSELHATADFSFTSKKQVTVSLDLKALLDINNQTGQRAYISIYRDYSLLPSGQFYPDSSSRVLAGELYDGLFKHSFVAVNNQSSYLIEVWFYNGEQPVQKQQTVIANRLTW